MAIRSSKPGLEKLFRTLADRTRLRILNLISTQEVCVCHFAEIFGTNQPKISRHLAYLRASGLVRARRDGKWMHYSLLPPSDPAVSRILKDALTLLRQDKDAARDSERLSSVCCVVDQLVKISIAPAKKQGA